VTTEFSETGHRYQLIVRGECGPLTEWLFGDAAIETVLHLPLRASLAHPGASPLYGRGTP
jgi:hypothetical protein